MVTLTQPKGIDNKENGIFEIRGDVTTKETGNWLND